MSYLVQYTKHITQKSKVWCDGMLRQNGKKCTLHDEDNKVIDSAWLKPTMIAVGNQCRTEKFLVQIIEETSDSPPSSSSKNEDTTSTVSHGAVKISQDKFQDAVKRSFTRNKLRPKSLGPRRKRILTPIAKPEPITRGKRERFDTTEEDFPEEESPPPQIPTSFVSATSIAANNRSKTLHKSSDDTNTSNNTRNNSNSRTYNNNNNNNNNNGRSSSFSYSRSNSDIGKVEKLPPPPKEGRTRNDIIALLEQPL